MPNVLLTHTYPKTEFSKSKLLKKAWEYIRLGETKKTAFKKAWDETTRMKTSFWTNASEEDIKWVIKKHQENGKVRLDLIRKWDSNIIKHPLDWVGYHLIRAGFDVIEPRPNIYSKTYEIPKL